jgi:hypothetical protein
MPLFGIFINVVQKLYGQPLYTYFEYLHDMSISVNKKESVFLYIYIHILHSVMMS